MTETNTDLAVARGVTYGVLFPLRFVSDGWAIWKLWGWFVVPLGIMPLAFWQAVGLDTLAGFFIAVSVVASETDPERRFTLFLSRSFAAPLAVFFGWIAFLIWKHL